jgi:hypothetical protein
MRPASANPASATLTPAAEQSAVQRMPHVQCLAVYKGAQRSVRSNRCACSVTDIRSGSCRIRHGSAPADGWLITAAPRHGLRRRATQCRKRSDSDPNAACFLRARDADRRKHGHDFHYPAPATVIIVDRAGWHAGRTGPMRDLSSRILGRSACLSISPERTTKHRRRAQ